MWLGSNNRAFTPTVTVLAGPTNLQATLIGLNSQGETQSFGGQPIPQPTAPNRTDLACDTYPGGANGGYNWYRSDDFGIYVFKKNTALPAWSDINATSCANGVPGGGLIKYPCRNYRWKVTALVNGVETQKSLPQKFVVYADGVKNGIGQDFSDLADATFDYNDTTIAPPGQQCLKITQTGNFWYWLPVLGRSCSLWDLWVGGYTHLKMDVYTSVASPDIHLYALLAGDVNITTDSAGNNDLNVQLQSYATLTQNAWVTVLVPLADFLTSQRGGVPNFQEALYKFGMQPQGWSNGQFLGINNVEIVAIEPALTLPTVPTALAATAASTSQLNLTWSASTDT